jgi:hypothetical protein
MSEPTTMRDQIEAAFDSSEPEVVNEPVSAPEPAPEPAAVSEPAAESAPAEPQQDLNALAEGAKEESVRDRDEQGRFKAKEQEGIQPGPKPGPKQQAERAPASWRPDVREHWAQLPEPVRAEVQRLEVERNRVLQESAEARKGYDAVMKTIAPYEGFIRAENSNALQAIDNLMSTAARLRTGTAPELAQLVSGIINQFGVGRFGKGFIEMLDSALVGQVPAMDPQQAALDQVLNQRLAPMQQMFNQFQQAQQAQQQRVTQQAQSEVSQFIERAEFGADVREEMADIIEAASRRGQNMSLIDAYKKACMLNDNVRAVISQRMKNAGAQQQTQAAQRARSAAVSVSGGAPVGGLKQDPTNVRAAIEAAIVQTAR